MTTAADEVLWEAPSAQSESKGAPGIDSLVGRIVGGPTCRGVDPRHLRLAGRRAG